MALARIGPLWLAGVRDGIALTTLYLDRAPLASSSLQSFPRRSRRAKGSTLTPHGGLSLRCNRCDSEKFMFAGHRVRIFCQYRDRRRFEKARRRIRGDCPRRLNLLREARR